jgi:hypothetical protein
MLLTPSLASAENDGHFLRFPAAYCNHNGLQPNAAAGLGNWTGSSKNAYCPLLTDVSRQIQHVQIYMSRTSTGPGSTCFLKMVNPAGNGGWTYSHVAVNFGPTYAQMHWGGTNYWPESGAAIECTVPNGHTLQSFQAYVRLDDTE